MYGVLAAALILAFGAWTTLGTARAVLHWATSQHYSYELAMTGEDQRSAVLERARLTVVRQ